MLRAFLKIEHNLRKPLIVVSRCRTPAFAWRVVAPVLEFEEFSGFSYPGVLYNHTSANVGCQTYCAFPKTLGIDDHRPHDHNWLRWRSYDLAAEAHSLRSDRAELQPREIDCELRGHNRAHAIRGQAK